MDIAHNALIRKEPRGQPARHSYLDQQRGFRHSGQAVVRRRDME